MPPIASVLHLERRGRKRYDLELRVAFSWNGAPQQGTSRNLSLTGMRLHCGVDMGRGLRLVSYFALPGDPHMVRLESEVRWVRPAKAGGGKFECGLQFHNMPPRTTAALTRLIETLEVQNDADLPWAEAEEALESHDTIEFVVPAGLPGVRRTAPTGPNEDFTKANLRGALQHDTKQRAADQDEARILLDDARTALTHDNPSHAVDLMRRATRLVSDSPELYEVLAEALYRSGDVVGSADAFDKALRLQQE